MVPGVEADELDPLFFFSLQSIDCVGASGDPNLGARTDEGEVKPELRARADIRTITTTFIAGEMREHERNGDGRWTCRRGQAPSG